MMWTKESLHWRGKAWLLQRHQARGAAGREPSSRKENVMHSWGCAARKKEAERLAAAGDLGGSSCARRKQAGPHPLGGACWPAGAPLRCTCRASACSHSGTWCTPRPTTHCDMGRDGARVRGVPAAYAAAGADLSSRVVECVQNNSGRRPLQQRNNCAPFRAVVLRAARAAALRVGAPPRGAALAGGARPVALGAGVLAGGAGDCGAQGEEQGAQRGADDPESAGPGECMASAGGAGSAGQQPLTGPGPDPGPLGGDHTAIRELAVRPDLRERGGAGVWEGRGQRAGRPRPGRRSGRRAAAAAAAFATAAAPLIPRQCRRRPSFAPRSCSGRGTERRLRVGRENVGAHGGWAAAQALQRASPPCAASPSPLPSRPLPCPLPQPTHSQPGP